MMWPRSLMGTLRGAASPSSAGWWPMPPPHSTASRSFFRSLGSAHHVADPGSPSLRAGTRSRVMRAVAVPGD